MFLVILIILVIFVHQCYTNEMLNQVDLSKCNKVKCFVLLDKYYSVNSAYKLRLF